VFNYAAWPFGEQSQSSASKDWPWEVGHGARPSGNWPKVFG